MESLPFVLFVLLYLLVGKLKSISVGPIHLDFKSEGDREMRGASEGGRRAFRRGAEVPLLGGGGRRRRRRGRR